MRRIVPMFTLANCMSNVHRLDRVEMFAAAQFLGDLPQTVLPYHALVTGRCEAWIAGALPQPRALVVRTHFVPSEPFAFGRDAPAVAEMFSTINGWTSVNAGGALMESLPAELARHTGRHVKSYGDLYSVIATPAAPISHPNVRLLRGEDELLFTSSPLPVAPQNSKLIPLIIREGLCAAAVVDDRIVARAFAYAVTPTYADLSVATLPTHRNRGLVTACASLLIAELKNHKLAPVWSTGQDNLPSQRVAAKLGFVPTTPRVYLSLE